MHRYGKQGKTKPGYMTAPHIFFKWVPEWLRIPLLFVLYFVSLGFNGVYIGNTSEVFSGLGVYIEPYFAAYNAIYIGMGIGFMIHGRLAARFSVKEMLLMGFIVQLLTNIICGISPYPEVTMLSCLILGFGKAAAVKEFFAAWVLVWHGKGDRVVAYPFVFAFALSGSFFISWWMTSLAYMYNWSYAYVYIIMGLLASLLLVVIFVEDQPLRRKIPLYQMDWTGILLMTVFFMLISYVSTYGQVEDWFNSSSICIATSLIPVTGFAFLLREATVKRPVFDLSFFRVKQFIPGLLLLMIAGLYIPTSIQLLFSQKALKFELLRSYELNLYMIPGFIAGAVSAHMWYKYRRTHHVLIYAGMSAFILYNILLYQTVTSSNGTQDFWLPGIIRGFGMVLIFISLGLYTTEVFGKDVSIKATGMMLIVRSFVSRSIAQGVLNYMLYAGSVKHLVRQANGIDITDRNRWQAGHHPQDYLSFIQQQAYLAATKELTGIIVIIGVSTMLVLALIHIVAKKTPAAEQPA